MTSAAAAGEPVRLGATTTLRDSGFLEYLVDRYRRETGETVISVVAGTGLILAQAARGDFEVTLTHDENAELAFIEAGHAEFHAPVMANRFILLGPSDDPAGVRGLSDRAEALTAIAESQTRFVSRGDDSGTHRRERALWREAGVDPAAGRETWYIESGAGMGTTLNIAAERRAYVLSDLGTWLAYRARGGLDLIVEGTGKFDNFYRVILVAAPPSAGDPGAARAFVDWLASNETKQAIDEFRIDGERAYFAVD